MSEEAKIECLIVTFQENFDSIISYFVALPMAERTYSNLRRRFIQEATTKKNRNGGSDKRRDEEPAAFLSRYNLQQHKIHNSKQVICYKCNKVCHIATKCYSKVNNRNFSNNITNFDGNRPKMKCFKCDKEGHIAYFCRNRNNKSENKSVSSSKSKNVFFAIALMAQNEVLSENECLFYLDSGANDHMIGK